MTTKGSRGAQGKVGVQGKIGKRGAQGFTGLIGNQGVVGLKGKVGAQGPQGVKGQKGPLSTAPGKPGNPGGGGPAGGVGTPGPAGADGPTGFPGRAGFPGPSQSIPVLGPPGKTGPQGSPGPAGKAGNNAIAPGPAGKAGAVGAPGGPQGPAGSPGKSCDEFRGALACKGNQGFPGPAGSNGNAGTDADKSAIVKYNDEYVTLTCVEMPEARFEDQMLIKTNGETFLEIDLNNTYCEICEKGTIKPYSAVPSLPSLCAAKVEGNKLFLETTNNDKNLTVLVKLIGTRKEVTARFKRQSKYAMLKNNSFWNSWRHNDN